MKILALSLLIAGIAHAGEITIHASADASVLKNKPTENFGTNAVLSVKAIPFSVKHAFVCFDLAELKGAKIKAATLVLTTSMHHAGEQTIRVAGLKESAPWDEKTITWETAPTGTKDLGTFTSKRESKLSGETVTFSGSALVEFLNEHSLPTLVLTSTLPSEKEDAGFAAKKNKTLPPPTLKLVTQ
jgi:hypothetical protein